MNDLSKDYHWSYIGRCSKCMGEVYREKITDKLHFDCDCSKWFRSLIPLYLDASIITKPFKWSMVEQGVY